MKKIYSLKTCDTCKRILSEVDTSDFEIQEIKSENITSSQLDELYNLSGSYESLFNKRSRLYREKNLKEQKLSEQEYRTYILEEYTFLKRPVFVINDKIFVGNSKKTIEELKSFLG